MEILSVGNVVSFFYPAANYEGARPDLEQRQIRITKVRDLRDEPLDLVTMTICPTLRRGTVLVTGLDLQKGVERSFYVESMTELRACGRVFDGPCEVRILETDSDNEVVHRGTADSSLLFARLWMENPLGMAVAISPAR